jgi:hypothetical protein
MADTTEVLGWASMTAMVNEVKTPHKFIRELLFSQEDARPTETMEIGILVGDRVVAPFVRRGAQAIEVTPFQEKMYPVNFPNIRIKRHLEASELLFNRRVGHVIFVDEAEVLDAAQEHVARNSLRLVQMVEEAEEYLCAQALRGSISYEVDGEEAFSVTFPRDTDHNVTLMNFWNGMSADIQGDFRPAAGLVNDATGLNVTHVILGDEATDAFLGDAGVQALLDNRRITAGGLDLTQRFNQSGALYLGTFIGGIQVWSYTRATQVPSEQGLAATTSFDLVRSKYAEFVVADPAAENVMYYGAISDLKAIQGRLFRGKRFSKSWEQEDPSVMWQLLHSRPLPVMRRPDSTVSMKVVSG